ncbi:MAG: FAD-binding protein [Acidimicrobiales bacterium]
MSSYSEQNWSGYAAFHRSAIHEPTSTAELQKLVASAERVGVIGSRHSFNDIADTTGDLVWLGRLDPALDIDPQQMTASFGAGTTYEQLAPKLHEAGLALANTASLTHITVAGACATGTHGSGNRLGNLSTAVSELELVTATGDLLTLRRGDENFDGAVVALGGLGVVSRLTVDVEPTFEVRQYIYTDLHFDDFYNHFDEVTSAGYSVSLFPSFQHPWSETVWVKERLNAHTSSDPTPNLFGAALQLEHPKPARSDRTMTELDTPGPWHERLPHFSFLDPMAEATELQSEYFVARDVAVDAIKAVAELGPEMADIIEISELRTIAADQLWLSPAYGSDSVAIHFNWYKDAAGVEAVLPILEAALAPFSPRPHWGKLFDLTPQQIEAAYPRIDDFRRLRHDLDPDQKFTNRYLQTHVLNEG